MSASTPTLDRLNETDDPNEFDGDMLGDAGVTLYCKEFHMTAENIASQYAKTIKAGEYGSVEKKVALPKKPASTPTLDRLNETDDPNEFDGDMLGDDGKNQLWQFGEKVANREYVTDEVSGVETITWSADVAGWNCNPETDALS
jgi:hypothetical protein